MTANLPGGYSDTYSFSEYGMGTSSGFMSFGITKAILLYEFLLLKNTGVVIAIFCFL